MMNDKYFNAQYIIEKLTHYFLGCFTKFVQQRFDETLTTKILLPLCSLDPSLRILLLRIESCLNYG